MLSDWIIQFAIYSILSLSYTIVLKGVANSKLMLNTMLTTKTPESPINIFLPIVYAYPLDRKSRLLLYKYLVGLESIKYVTLVLQKVHLCMFREVINTIEHILGPWKKSWKWHAVTRYQLQRCLGTCDLTFEKIILEMFSKCTTLTNSLSAWNLR